MSLTTSSKSIVKQFLAGTGLGVPLSRMFYSLGADQLGRHVSYIATRQVPDIVIITLPEYIKKATRFRMYTVGGRDQVARVLWLKNWHHYEKPLPDFFAAYAQRAKVILDIGANTGFYSLIAAFSSDTAKIYAFDPYPPAQKLLKNNLVLNKVSERVTMVPLAISNLNDEADLFVPTSEHGLIETSSSLNRNFRKTHSEVCRVTVSTLDHFVKENNLDSVDLIKLDIENQEHLALQGANLVLKKFRPVIFFEVIEQFDCEAIEQIRKKYNYLVFRLGSTIRKVNQIAIDKNNWNQVLCPEEKVATLNEIATRLGYKME
ncbi:MAG: FkbM family methyltransferase [Bacteroidetes bacterium]|nr:FkbM family methyltransferase [Bacteroidota bacterium]